jgi:hypothetical protein
MHKTYPKHEYVRSKLLVETYRKIPCQICGRDDGTVCAAHSNWSGHGKGKGIKADDDRCASLCYTCHSSLDQGKTLTHDDKRSLWEMAHRKSVRELLERGLWPKSIRIPDIGLSTKDDILP